MRQVIDQLRQTKNLFENKLHASTGISRSADRAKELVVEALWLVGHGVSETGFNARTRVH